MAQKADTGVVPPELTPAVLTAQWWQWAISAPIRQPAYTGPIYNPLFDATGEAAGNGQPQGVPLFFLGGAMFAIDQFGNPIGPVPGPVSRTITIPAGKFLFFPVANVEFDNVGVPEDQWSTVSQLQAGAAGYADGFRAMRCSVDGRAVGDIQKHRLAYAPFAYTLPAEDNIYQLFGLDVTGEQYPAASDGYWLLLRPLSPGAHTIEFANTTPYGDKQKTTYHITVAPL